MSVTHHTGKKLDRIIIVLLVLALGYFAFDKFVLDPARDVELVKETAQQARSEALVESYGDKSIAVLPFINMSAEPEQEYFSDGISEELLNLLAQIPELRVISRSSAFSFKGKDVKLADVARELNVAHILEGSVRKAGNRVRITAQLIEARSDTHLWSDTYDRELDDIFAIQDEIAAAISVALKMKLKLVAGEVMQPEAIEAANTDAYDAYLQGRELIHRRGRENMGSAVSQLERALRLNESFAPAHAQLAIAKTMLLFYSVYSREEGRQSVIAHLDRSQELEPDLAEAYRGWALLARLDGDVESQLEHAQKALAVNPNYINAMNSLLNPLVALGRYQEANAVRKQMMLIDPLSVIGRANYAVWLGSQGQTEEAHQLADQLLAQSQLIGYRMHAQISQLSEGKLAESLSWALKAQTYDEYAMWAFIWVGEYDEARRISTWNLPWIDFLEGRWDEAIRATQEKLQLHPDRQGTLQNAAEVLYLTGRVDEALPLYERLLDFAPEGRPIPGYGSLQLTMRLAFVRRKAGDEEGAQAAAQIARQDHATRRAAGGKNWLQDLAEAMIAAFDNNPEGAIAALKLAIQRGLPGLAILDEPIFEDVRGEPRFVALRQELDAILAAEHDKALQLICFNNPVPDDWQPMPETCEGVEEQSKL